MSAWAKPGVKCVCIDADPYGGEWYGIAPVVGETYVFIEHRGTPVKEPCGTFSTLAGVPINYGGRVWICRFRPLITLEDDIAAHFEVHLKTDHREPAKADA